MTTTGSLPAITVPTGHHPLGDPGIDDRLRDPAPDVRLAALIALIRTAPPAAGDTLAWALADEDERVRQVAADALGDIAEVYIGADGVRALLLAAAGGRDERVRGTAAGLLALLTKGAGELYAQGLHDGEPQIRLQAISALVTLHAAAEVAEAADDPAREVRVAVAEGLGRLDAPIGLPALEQLVGDHDPVVRIAAIDAVADLGLPGRLTEALAAAVDHSNWQVRKHAVVALGCAEPGDAIDPLTRALRDRVVDVRRAAVGSLEKWATDRPEVVTALTEALADPDPGVRTQVRWALA
jgi:HEAT repeat protein